MPKKKTFNRQLGSSSMWREFKKFWHKLDHMQQVSLMAFIIVALSIPLGLSIATQKELLTMQSQAQEVQYQQQSLTRQVNQQTETQEMYLDEAEDNEEDDFLRNPMINLGF